MILNEYGHAQLEQRISAFEQARRAYRSTLSDDDKRVYELLAFELAEFVFWNRDLIFYLYHDSGPDGLRLLLRSDGSDGSGLCSGPAAPTGSDGSGATG